MTDIFNHDYTTSHCHVSRCCSRNCKTCNILNTSPSFTSALTNKTYSTQGYGDIKCNTPNVVYGIICAHCGIIYVGETKVPLNKRINGHRYQINNNGNQLLYQHFNQPDHSILSMSVIVLEKIYHHTNSPILSTPYRRQRDESHGHRHYTPARLNCISFVDLLNCFDEPLGIHHVRTKLFALSLTSLHSLLNDCLNMAYSNQLSNEYRLKSIILDIANSRLFRPVNSNNPTDVSSRFMTLKFANKGIDAINISNILHHKYVKAKVPAYFNNQTTPRISYAYTIPIASKVFNYKQSLRDLQVNNLLGQLPSCSCSNSPFLYRPAGHVVTGDLNIVDDPNLRDILFKGPKYREARPFSWKYNFKLVMDTVEQYARDWAKQEEVDVDCLSEWVKSIRRLLQRRIYMVSRSVNTKPKSIFEDTDVKRHLADLHEQYVLVPADKASNNVVFVCKTYFYSCLMEELGMKGSNINPSYERTNFDKEVILSNHKSVLSSFGISTKDCDLDLPSLYWMPKLHKNPYKQRFIAGSSKCSTKPLSVVLTSILTTIKVGLQKYCETIYSRNGINQLWILKNSKELLETLQANSYASVNSIKTYDFSTLYTTIPHGKLKSRIKDIIWQAFNYRNGNKRYEYIVVNFTSTYFVKNHTDAKNKYSEADVVKMLEFLIDNIFVEFGGHIFQQVVGIPMGTNCAPLLADLFLYSYEAEFIQDLIKSGKRQLAKSFSSTFRYIDDVISLNNPKFGDYINDIYPEELEIKDTTDAVNQASYLDLLLQYDDDHRLQVKLYDKRDDFNFTIVNFPFLCSNIPQSPAYGVYVSQLVRYARASSLYDDFLMRSRLLTMRLLKQGYIRNRLITTFKKFYGRHSLLVKKYNKSVTNIITDIFLETLYRT